MPFRAYNIHTGLYSSKLTELTESNNARVESLSVKGNSTVSGSIKAGNIASAVLTVVPDTRGFYTWYHPQMKGPVAHFATPEGGEVLRVIASTNRSVQIFLYTDNPVRINFLAIGI
jgi:hypothetical protein